MLTTPAVGWALPPSHPIATRLSPLPLPCGFEPFETDGSATGLPCFKGPSAFPFPAKERDCASHRRHLAFPPPGRFATGPSMASCQPSLSSYQPSQASPNIPPTGLRGEGAHVYSSHTHRRPVTKMLNLQRERQSSNHAIVPFDLPHCPPESLILRRSPSTSSPAPSRPISKQVFTSILQHRSRTFAIPLPSRPFAIPLPSSHLLVPSFSDANQFPG